MTTSPRRFAQDMLPSPFPEGWYFVASRQALTKAKLIQKTWMGENIVAWADEAGRVCVAEAYCSHLGSDLGPAAGGRIRNGRLVCPFHGYEYDATGQVCGHPLRRPAKDREIAGLRDAGRCRVQSLTDDRALHGERSSWPSGLEPRVRTGPEAALAASPDFLRWKSVR